MIIPKSIVIIILNLFVFLVISIDPETSMALGPVSQTAPIDCGEKPLLIETYERISYISLVAGFVLALSLFVTTPEAATSGGLYDMSRFVDEPHPFAKTPVSPRLSIEKPLIPPKMVKPNKNNLNVKLTFKQVT